MPFFFFFYYYYYFLLTFFPSLPLSGASAPIQNRRTLHQPFFPLENTLPPALPPTFPPSSLPKFPSSTNQNPFFPFYPSRPPPPPHSPTAISSFPANISSLIAPHSLPKKPFSIKLLLTILLPLFSVVVFAAVAFFIYRRHHNLTKEAAGTDDHHRLFPTDPLPSDNDHHHKTGVVESSEFFHPGAVGNSRHTAGDSGVEECSSGSVSGYQKLSSPELHPLPPLAHQFRHNYGNADPGSSEDEFYSPRGSSGEKESPAVAIGTSSRRVFPVPEAEKYGGRSSNSSTLSYPSSNSASPVQSPLKSPSPPLNYIGEDVRFRQQLRPLTPLPLMRKPTSLSPPTSPREKDFNNISRQNQEPFAKTESYSGNPFSDGPPPAPPPPPAGYWEAPRPTLTRPPVLVTPRIVGLKNPTVASAELVENLDSEERNWETPRPKLKPLHWDKVRASSDRAMVWDQLKSSSFQLNEEMIETLFICNAGNSGPNDTIRRSVPPLLNQENRVLDPKKSQNIAILLRALNVTKEEVCEALLEGNADGLGTELLETLLKMAPTKEEERKLKEYKDDSPFKLGPAEKFLKAVLDIPFAFKRVDAMLYICNFDSEIKYLEKSFETLEAACEELRSSRLFLKLLEAVLKAGNRMNVGTNRGDAQAFKLDTLLKLVDVKGTDGKTTLLHFVVQEIIRSEGSRLSATAKTDQQHTFRDDVEFKKLGLQVVAGLGGELSSMKKAATIDSDMLSSYVSKLAGGIGKISEVTSQNETMTLHESGHKYSQAMNGFLKKAEEELIKIQEQERATFSLVKEITEYFHGNSAKEEAHPFRIFTVVRDFLSILDQVCKEVGKINDRTIVGSAHQFPVSNNQALPPVFPTFHVRRPDSSDDDESSLSS